VGIDGGFRAIRQKWEQVAEEQSQKEKQRDQEQYFF
jgi:hypothetical protein